MNATFGILHFVDSRKWAGVPKAINAILSIEIEPRSLQPTHLAEGDHPRHRHPRLKLRLLLKLRPSLRPRPMRRAKLKPKLRLERI